MLVLHVVAPGEVGGLERVVQLLARGQVCSGDEVHVAAVLDQAKPDHELLDALRAGGVTTHSIVLPGRAYWRERSALLELGRRLRPSVVHTHGYRPDVVDGRVARAVGAASVTTAHGFVGGSVRNRCYEWLQRQCFRWFDAVVAVSQPLAHRLVRSGVPARRVHVVVNAWAETAVRLDRAAARDALGLPDDAFTVGWVGRLSFEKGLDVLLDALPHLMDLPISVAVLGDGREKAALERRAERRAVASRVVWHGLVPDAQRLFAAFDVFVLSSRTEGTPMVLYEAMAAGVPIVTTDVGGVPYMVQSAEALLVPPDSPRSLATAVRRVYQQREESAARVRTARDRLTRENDVNSWVKRYSGVYRTASFAASERS